MSRRVDYAEIARLEKELGFTVEEAALEKQHQHDSLLRAWLRSYLIIAKPFSLLLHYDQHLQGHGNGGYRDCGLCLVSAVTFAGLTFFGFFFALIGTIGFLSYWDFQDLSISLFGLLAMPPLGSISYRLWCNSDKTYDKIVKLRRTP